jgi:hypothetical protein
MKEGFVAVEISVEGGVKREATKTEKIKTKRQLDGKKTAQRSLCRSIAIAPGSPADSTSRKAAQS